MEAHLIFNANAGGTDDLDPEALQAALRDAGYAPVCHTTESEAALDEVLDEAEGLVVIAGGDGSVRSAAVRVARLREGGRDLPMALLPLGTANNITASLGIEGDPEALLRGLAEPRKRPFDLGRARAPWGEMLFLEAFGVGLYAETLASYQPERGKSLLRAVRTIADDVIDFEPRRWRLELDGERFDGELVMVEAQNTRRFGPGVNLAPEADPSDGRLDLVIVEHDPERTFLEYGQRLMQERLGELDNVHYRRVERCRVSWAGSPVHADIEVMPEAAEAQGGDAGAEDQRRSDATIDISVWAGALELWLPPSADDAEAVQDGVVEAAPTGGTPVGGTGAGAKA